MKNAMKKFMSLTLVAMILVSAVVFPAAATETEETVAPVVEETQAETVVTEAPEAKEATVPETEAPTVEVTEAPAAPVVEATEPEAPVAPVEETTDAPIVVDAEPKATTIKLVVKAGSSDNVVFECENAPKAGSATVENMLTYWFNKDWKSVYTFDHAWSKAGQKNVSLSDSIKVGDTLSVMLKQKSNGGNSFDANTGKEEVSDKLEGYTKFHEDVYLYIYADTTVGTVKKSVKITDGIAADGKVTLNEVKSVVKQYFKAIDGNVGITYDGLYPVQGNWVADYAADKKYDTIDGLYEAAAKQTVIIRVMVGNAKLISSSSSNADSSNPKTGDEIYMAVTAMAVSASALAVGFYFLKKRAI